MHQRHRDVMRTESAVEPRTGSNQIVDLPGRLHTGEAAAEARVKIDGPLPSHEGSIAQPSGSQDSHPMACSHITTPPA